MTIISVSARVKAVFKARFKHRIKPLLVISIAGFLSAATAVSAQPFRDAPAWQPPATFSLPDPIIALKSAVANPSAGGKLRSAIFHSTPSKATTAHIKTDQAYALGLAYMSADEALIAYPLDGHELVRYPVGAGTVGTDLGKGSDKATDKAVKLPVEPSDSIDLAVAVGAMKLAGTQVPAGSLLMLDGNPAKPAIQAIDPRTAAVLARLPLAIHEPLVGLTWHPERQSLYSLSISGNELLELSAFDATVLGRWPLAPAGSPEFSAGLGDIKLRASSGKLWVVGDSEARIREFTAQGAYVRDLRYAGFVQDKTGKIDTATGIATIKGSREIWMSGFDGLYRFDPEAPVIEAFTAEVLQGKTMLKWTAQNADACVAEDGWAGNKKLKGDEAVQAAGGDAKESKTTYTLVCSRGDQQDSRTVAVPNATENGILAFDASSINVLESAGSVSVTVSRSGDSVGAVSVQYATQDSSAQAGLDYTARSGTLNWANGDFAPKTITVPILDDNITDPSEQFFTVLSDPTGGAQLQNNYAYITIRENTSAGVLQFVANSQTVSEGAGTATVAVTRAGGSRGAISVDYSMQDNSALAGLDYTARSGTLNWADGDVAPRTISVPILEDNLTEGDEGFFIFLSNPGNGARLGVTQTYITLNESTASAGFLQFAANSQTVSEGAGTVTVTVTRAQGSRGAISVDYATQDNSAQAGTDYTVRNGTLNWADGDVTPKAITVPILEDNVTEGDEGFFVLLSNPGNGARLGSPPQTYITLNESTASAGFLQFAANNRTVSEGAGTVTVAVTRAQGSRGAISVDYATQDNSAQAGTDYTARSGTLNWADGDIAPKTFTVPVLEDNLTEGDEGFFVLLSNPGNGARLGSPPQTYITLNESTASAGFLQFSANQYFVREAAGNVTVSVSRVRGSRGAVSVVYATQDSSAQAGSDYTARSGSLNWADGDLAPKTFTVPVLNDSVVEGDESFIVTLASPTGSAQLGSPSSSSITLAENAVGAGRLGFAQDGYSISETGGSVTVTVQRLAGSNGAVSVNYATREDFYYSARESTDFTPRSGTLNWAAGDVAPKTFTVPIVNDNLTESDEIFAVSLSDPAGGAQLGQSTSVITIVESVSAGVLGFTQDGYSISETGGSVTVTVQRTAGSNGVVSVNYATREDFYYSAREGTDFTPRSGTLNWAAGDVAPKTFTVPIINDNLTESDEIFAVSLSDPAGGAQLGQPTSVITINERNSGGRLGFAQDGYSVSETGGSVTVTVQRTGGSNGAVSIDYYTGDNSARVNDDYLSRAGTLSWANNDVAPKTITVPIVNDNLTEGDESFAVNLGNPTGGAQQSNFTTYVTINERNSGGRLGFVQDGYSVAESGGSVTLTVQRTGGSSGAVSIDYYTGDSSARVNDDYLSRAGTLTWANNDAAPKTITVPIVNDNLTEGDEGFAVYLGNPTGGAQQVNSTVYVTINETASAGRIQFNADQAAVSESGGSVTVAVSRTEGSNGAVSVIYATQNNSATAGTDYSAQSGSLTWANGDLAPKNITIPILNDSTTEGDENFLITLSNSDGSAQLGAPQTMYITIREFASAGFVQFNPAGYTVNENGGSVTLTATRTGGSSGAVAVSYATQNNSALAGSDYSSRSGTLNWASGDVAPKTFSVPILVTAGAEPDEVFLATLSSPTNGLSLGSSPTAFVTITEPQNPGTVQLSSAGYSVNEGGASALVTLTRTDGSFGAASVRLATSNGTATAGSDYTAVSQTVNWADGDAAAKTVSIPITQDATDEPDETVNLTLSTVTGATLGSPASGSLTIVDDDDAAGFVQLSAATYSIDESGGNAVITLTRSGGAAGAASVRLATSNGTATASDYTAVSQTVNWANGDSAAKTVSIAILQDTTDEPNETVNLALSNVTGALLGSPATAVLTIVDDDNPPGGSLQFSAASYSVGEAGGNAVITLTRTDGSFGAASVQVATSNGSATAGSDYTATSRTVSWADGDTAAKTVSIPVLQDTTDEPDETVNLSLSAVTSAVLGSSTTAVLSIVDDDDAPAGSVQLSATAYSVSEAGGNAVITLTRSGGSFGAASVRLATSNGTATAGADYTATIVIVNWTDGDAAAKTISVPVIQDTTDEPNETVNLALSTVTGATLGSPATAVLTILDDDDAPAGSVQLSAASYSAGEAAGNAVVTLTRTGGSFGAASVRLATSNGTAIAGSDYTATSVIVNWADGDSAAKTVSVPVLQDTTDEPNETVNLALSAVAGATLGSPATGVLTIVDDDDAPAGSVQLSATSYSVNEGGGTAAITLTRTGGSFGAASVLLATSNGSATAGADYTATTATVSWADGDAATKTVNIPVLQDSTDEPNETVNLALSAVTGATLGSPATGVLTIVDDDDAPAGSVQLGAATYSAGEAAGNAVVTLTRTGGSFGAASVRLNTSNGTATAGADYTATSVTVNWVDGDAAAKTVSIPVLQDPTDEPDETVNLALGSVTGATLGTPATALLTIVDDDNPPAGSVQLSAATYSAGEAAGNAVITLTRSGGSFGAASVLLATSNGTATAGADYTATTTIVSWIDGDTAAKTVSIPVIQDPTDEPNETVNLALSAVSGATLGSPAAAVLTIVDDDNPPAGSVQLSAASYSAGEASGNAQITLTRTDGSFGAASVRLATSNGTATAGSDYTATTATVNWADGDTAAKTVSIPVIQDPTDEPEESVNITLSNVSGATLGSPATAVLTIVDDDNPPAGSVQFNASSYSAGEAAGTAIVTVTRTGGSFGDASVRVTTSNGTATAGSDYTATTRTVTWTDGDTAAKTVSIPVLQDATDEPNETVNLALSDATGATVGSPVAAVLTIVDDDDAPAGSVQLSATSYSAGEAAGNAVITLTRTGGSFGAASVAFASSNGTATAGGDYTATATTVNWADGDSAAKTVSVPVVQDPTDEPDETVNIALSSVTGATLGSPASAVLTIVDDDNPPTGSVSLSAASYSAGEAAGNAVVTLTRSGGSFGTASIVLATSNGTATAGSDYTATSVTVNWADGDAAAKTVSIPVIQDATDEPNETVNLALSGVTGATLGSPATAVLTIVDDDDAPAGSVQLSAASYSAGEAAGNAAITLTRTGGSFGAASVRLATSNGTAAAGSDYTATTTTVSWADGDSAAKTVSVPVLQDSTDEPDETVNLTLSSVTGATLGSPATAVLTIVDDDNPPAGSVQLSAASYSAGEAAGNAAITLTRTGGSFGAASVRLATSNGTAMAGADYTATSTIVSWVDGDSAAKTVSVPVTQDLIDEPNETVNISLSDATSATIGSPATAVLTIVDDDDAPAGSVQLSAATYSAVESAGNAVITLTRSGGSFGAASVRLATSDGTAAAGSDYTATAATVSWADGDSAAKTVSIPVLQDPTDEPNETVNLALSGVTGATLGSPATAVLTIVDDDDAPAGIVQLSATGYSVSEAGGNAIVTLIRSGGSFGAASVVVATSNGSATAGADYSATTATVNWANGDNAAKTVSIPVLQDATDEPDETVNIALSSVTGATLGTPATAVLTVIDDDPTPGNQPTVTIAPIPSVNEGGPGVVATFTLSEISRLPVTVRIGFTGTAANLADFQRPPSTVTIRAGTLSSSITLVPIDDGLVEGSETATVSIVSAVNARVGTPSSSTLTVIENESPTVSIQPIPAVNEGGPAVAAVFTLSAPTNVPVTLRLSFSGVAANTRDFRRPSDTVTIPAGQLSASISLTPVDDAIAEASEQATVTILSATNARIGTGSSTVTVIDND